MQTAYDEVKEGYRFWLTRSIMARYDMLHVPLDKRVPLRQMAKLSDRALQDLWNRTVRKKAA